MATRPPVSRPAARSAPAIRATRSRTSDQVRRRSPSTLARPAGRTSAARRNAQVSDGIAASVHLLLAPGPERLAELRLQDLAGAGERQRLIADLDAARAL